MLTLVGVNTSDGVLECRFCWVVDQLVCRLVISADSLHESLLVILQTDTSEWHRVVRCLVGFKKWVDTFLYVLFVKHTNFV